MPTWMNRPRDTSAKSGPPLSPTQVSRLVANFVVHALLKKLGKESPEVHFQGEPTVSKPKRGGGGAAR